MSNDWYFQLDKDTRELVEMYQDEHPGQAAPVIAAFVVKGMEPPSTMGFTAKHSQVIQDFYSKYDPNGSRAEWANQESAGV